MNAWIGKTVLLMGLIVFVAIRAPYERRSKETKITESRRGAQETTLMVLMGIGCFVFPLIFIFSPLLSFANYRLHPVAFLGGIVCLIFGLWFFHRSHVDLGTNWSISLELDRKTVL